MHRSLQRLKDVAVRPRLLPVLIVVATLGVVLKLGEIWQGLSPMTQVMAAPSDTSGAEPGRAAESTAAKAAAPEPDTASGGNGRTPTAALPTDPFALTDEEIELLQRLAERRDEIERRAAELDQRSTLLEAAERRIDEKINELEVLRKTIEGLLVRHDEQENAQINSLVKIYESMKPKDAARIFEELDSAVLLDVIERMKERKTAPILAKMNPQRAKEITLELAQRRALPAAKR